MKRLVIGVLCVGLCSGCTVRDSSTEDVVENKTEVITDLTESTLWSPETLKKGLTTVVEYDKIYNAYVNTEEDAKQAIIDYGIEQRTKYSNPDVENIELQMEKEFDILAVNLGEIDYQTATEIYDAFVYMYQTYPQMQGRLTNLTIGNLNMNYTALTTRKEFIINGEFGKIPFVVKREIVLGAAKFLRRDRLLESCREQVDYGYWPENANISSIVVHELGHQLLDIYVAKYYGFEGFYVTEENEDAYWKYSSDALKVNQYVVHMLLQKAYGQWLVNNEGSESEFRASISGYAEGIQLDGGISYTETVAEAVTDVYLNGENAAEASKMIVKELEKGLSGY
ncbi:MAG: hypothetical protein K2L07_10920 [Lachnospiraceae bacterium]|nr:hypothetical protein [Lachnospiraceae bacterium]